MIGIREHAPGTFCYVELGTVDQERAGAFYQDLLGWKRADQDLGRSGRYTRFTRDGEVVAAMYELAPEQTGRGMSSQWFQYVAVESANATAARAVDLGGEILVGPLDVMEHGRMAILRSADSSLFCIWEPHANLGVELKDADGAMCWNELITRDLETSRVFYGDLLGWDARDTDTAGRPYTVCYLNDHATAGMLALPDDMPDVANHWLVYFAVANGDVVAARTAALGGTVLVEPTDLPTVGRFAVLQDPCGGVFGIVNLRGET